METRIMSGDRYLIASGVFDKFFRRAEPDDADDEPGTVTEPLKATPYFHPSAAQLIIDQHQAEVIRLHVQSHLQLNEMQIFWKDARVVRMSYEVVKIERGAA